MLKCSRGEATCSRLVTVRTEHEDRPFYWDFSNIRLTPHPHLNWIYESQEKGNHSSTLNMKARKTLRKMLKWAIRFIVLWLLSGASGYGWNIILGLHCKMACEHLCSLEQWISKQASWRIRGSAFLPFYYTIIQVITLIIEFFIFLTF